MPIRPFNWPADLDTLEALSYESFQYPENPEWGMQADDLDNMTAELGTIRRMWPLVRAIVLVYPRFIDLVSGYVWEEDGIPVGYAMLQPTAMMGSPAWEISRVAVLPSYRRHGIARQLVDASLALARGKGAQTITLSVFTQNVPAYRFYAGMGFEHYSGSTQMNRAAEVQIPERQPIPPGYIVNEATYSDWRPSYQLSDRITPPEVRDYKPVAQSNYHPPLLIRTLETFMDRFSGVAKGRTVVYRDEGAGEDSGEVVATASYRARLKPGGVNLIFFVLDPDCSELAPFLVGKLVQEVMERSPRRRIRFDQEVWGLPLVEAALEMGFTVRKEWHDMGMQLT